MRMICTMKMTKIIIKIILFPFKIILWPLKKIADLIDPNWWAEHIGEKSGIFEKARNSKIRAWALGLEGWKWWTWQIIVGGGMLWIFEIILNQIGMTMLPWR